MEYFKFDEQWLREAVKIEDEANCNIHAGLELGIHLDEYIELTKKCKNSNQRINNTRYNSKNKI